MTFMGVNGLFQQQYQLGFGASGFYSNGNISDNYFTQGSYLTGHGTPEEAFLSAFQFLNNDVENYNPYGLNFSQQANNQQQQQAQMNPWQQMLMQFLMMIMQMIMQMLGVNAMNQAQNNDPYNPFNNNQNYDNTPAGYATGRDTGNNGYEGNVNNSGTHNSNANPTGDANNGATGADDNAAPANAPVYQPSGETSPMGEMIARRAIEEVESRAKWQNMNEYWCGAGVGNVLNSLGLESGRADGSNWDQLLYDNPNFVEVNVSRENLDDLPPGCVVVWEEKDGISGDNDGDYGHVSISLGDGREASDRYRQQLNMTGREYHVFVPKDYVELYPEKFSSNGSFDPTKASTANNSNTTTTNNSTTTTNNSTTTTTNNSTSTTTNNSTASNTTSNNKKPVAV